MYGYDAYHEGYGMFAMQGRYGMYSMYDVNVCLVLRGSWGEGLGGWGSNT